LSSKGGTYQVQLSAFLCILLLLEISTCRTAGVFLYTAGFSSFRYPAETVVILQDVCDILQLCTDILHVFAG